MSEADLDYVRDCIRRQKPISAKRVAELMDALEAARREIAFLRAWIRSERTVADVDIDIELAKEG